MTTEQFTYWLQGFLETANPSSIDEKQTQIIKDHLALVFNKVTPNYHSLIKDMQKPLEIKDFGQPYPYEVKGPEWPYYPNQTIC